MPLHTAKHTNSLVVERRLNLVKESNLLLGFIELTLQQLTADDADQRCDIGLVDGHDLLVVLEGSQHLQRIRTRADTGMKATSS